MGACSPGCAKNQVCAGAACACADGFIPAPTGCVAAPADSPASHTRDDVCTHWKQGHVVTAPNPYTPGGTKCDPGSISAAGKIDALARIDMYRWMAGESAVTEDAEMSAGAQACAVIQANNDPISLGNPHDPPPSANCYTPLGGQWAGMSNVAMGEDLLTAIDSYVFEGPGGAVQLGHRRWLLYPFLGKVGIGFVSGGQNGDFSGLGQCLGVMDKSSSGPFPVFYSWPPAGYVPLDVLLPFIGTSWSFHSDYPIDPASAQIEVTNLTTGAAAPVTITPLEPGYGDDSVAFDPNGWKPSVGEVYRVAVALPALPAFVYEVKPVACP